MTKKIPPSDDCDLFRETIGNVRPIKNDKANLPPADKPKPYPKRQAIDYVAFSGHDRNSEVMTVGREDPLSFVVADAPKDTLARLRLGQFGVDAEIDLHGLSSDEAQRQLFAFIEACVQDRCRCVHVVHGKGYRSQDPYPILKNHINVWLRQHRYVQAFCSAAPRDGGAGAVYVLLYSGLKIR